MQVVTDQIRNFLQYIAVQFIEFPAEAQLKVTELGPKRLRFKLVLRQSDVALLIGRNGFSASAIRGVIKSITEREDVNVNLHGFSSSGSSIDTPAAGRSRSRQTSAGTRSRNPAPGGRGPEARARGRKPEPRSGARGRRTPMVGFWLRPRPGQPTRAFQKGRLVDETTGLLSRKAASGRRDRCFPFWEASLWSRRPRLSILERRFDKPSSPTSLSRKEPRGGM